MRGLVVASVAFASLIGTSAFAADMAVKAPMASAPAFSWTGFYVGIDGGGGWNARTGDARNSAGTTLFGGGTAAPTGAVERPSGGLVGGEAGYNFQSGPIVYGIETDIQWSDIRGSASVADPCCSPTFTGTPGVYNVSTKLDWFGTTRGRIGLAAPFDHWLLYVTGGAIYGHVSLTDSIVFPGIAYGPATTSSTRAGGVVGGGLEYAFAGSNLSAKVEGLYYDMGSITNAAQTSPPNGFTGGGTFAIRGAMVRGGLNWHFH